MKRQQRCLHTAGAAAVGTSSTMNKLLGVLFCAAALAACSNMSGTRSMGNSSPNAGETKNSTDANKARNPAAVSPGGSSPGTGSSSGTGAGAGTGSGTR